MSRAGDKQLKVLAECERASRELTTLHTYLVIALYEEDFQRYATSVEAENPEAAEVAAQEQADEDNGDHCPLIIAAVLLDGEVVA